MHRKCGSIIYIIGDILSIYQQMIDTYLSEERVVIMMSLSNAADGFCSTIAWNCADKALFGDAGGR